MDVKKIFLWSLVIWLVAINMGKIWPMSHGENYYLRLQKWYLLANNGNWTEAQKLETKLETGDIEYFKKMNNPEELIKRLNELTIKSDKNADDWVEIGVILYRNGKQKQGFEAIERAHKMDPIREDISKIYFTYQTLQPLPQQP